MTIEERVVTLEHEVEHLEQRIDKVESLTDTINTMAISIEKMAVTLEYNNQRLSAIEDNTKARGNTVFAAFMSAVIGGIIGYILNIVLK